MGIGIEAVYSILSEDLRLRRVLAKFVFKLLTEQQKELWKEISEDMQDFENHDPEFMETIIINDETWFVITNRNRVSILTMEAYEITKAQKSSTSSHQLESDAILFLWLPRYRALWMRSRRPGNQQGLLPGVSTGSSLPWCWAKKTVRYVGSKEFNFQIFHHDNDPAHSAHATQAFLAKNSMPLVRQAPYHSMPLVQQALYSLDLAPCDFWWLPNSERKAISITSRNYKKIDGRAL